MNISQLKSLRLIIISLMFFSFSLPAGTVSAETQYVSDQLIITLREGQGNQYKIIKMLKAGTPLEILEESEKFLRVSTADGQEGWVLKQYVTRETPKLEIITRMKKEIDRLKAKIGEFNKEKGSLLDELKQNESELKNQIKDLQKDVSASRGMADQTSRDLAAVTKKYNALMRDSKDVVQIVKERDNMKASYSELQTKTEQLQNENDELKQSQMIWWFVAGGSVFFVGWIVGKISRQKRFY